MQYILSVLWLLSTGFATEDNTVVLDMTLSISGELVSQSQVSLISGETERIESVTKDGVFSIEVTPTLNDKKTVQMLFVVAQLENDTKTI